MRIDLELLRVSEFALALFVIRVASGFDALAGGILDFSHDRNALKVEHMAEEPRRRDRANRAGSSAMELNLTSPFEVAPGSRPLPASGKPESVGSLEPLLRFRERQGERVGAAAR